MLKRIIDLNLILALFIILWGAWVRASGSGAGCGDHWPLCDGELIPPNPSVKTLTELLHRVTSGIFGFTVLGGWLLARKTQNRGLSRSLLGCLVFTLTEALIGALLVKKGLVVDNDSALRAGVISIHLINTLGLLYFLTLSALQVRAPQLQMRRLSWSLDKLFYVCFGLFMCVGASGAIAALGNTLFPETSLVAGIEKDFSATSHFLIQLRVLHPLSALSLALTLFYFVDEPHPPWSRALLIGVGVAVTWGVINWLLLAPTWGALIHLFIADCLFILFVGYQFQRRTKDEPL